MTDGLAVRLIAVSDCPLPFGSTGNFGAARRFAGAGIFFYLTLRVRHCPQGAWCPLILENIMKLLDKTMTNALLGPDVSYNALRKEAFHKTGKRLLRRVADELGLIKGQYDLRSNLAGIAVSGEITLHTDTLYLQLSQGALMQGAAQILYRSCAGRRDYVGHANHFIALSELQDQDNADRFIACLKKLGGLIPMTDAGYRIAA